MSAAQPTTIHAALSDALGGLKEAGQFRVVALADPCGLTWAVKGDVTAPDQLVCVPALLARAFADRQPLLRFFSEKVMRFEYHSDALRYIKSSLEGEPASASYTLDVPGDRVGKGRAARDARDVVDANEFIVAWDGDACLVLHHVLVNEETWCLLGITSNATAARVALQKAAPAIGRYLSEYAGVFHQNSAMGTGALHEKMMEALHTFQGAAPDIFLAAVTSKDGFVVASLDGGTLEADMVAPLIGHSFLAIQESTQRLCGATESVMLRMDEGVLLARELTDDLLFAALLAPSACTGLIVNAFETAAATLRTALEDMASAVSAPQEFEVAA